MKRWWLPVGVSAACLLLAVVVAPRQVWWLLLLLGGFLWGRWKAVICLGVAPWMVLALLADAAKLAGWVDRTNDRGWLTLSAIVIVPLLSALVAGGVLLRRLLAERIR